MSRRSLESRIIMLERMIRTEELESREDDLCFEFTEDEERLMRRAGDLTSKGEREAAESGPIMLGGKCFGEHSFMEFLSEEERETVREAARLLMRKREAREELRNKGAE